MSRKKKDRQFQGERQEKNMRSINAMRKELGMKELKMVKSNCLKCDKEMERYEHSDNWLCYKCRGIGEFDSFE